MKRSIIAIALVLVGCYDSRLRAGVDPPDAAVGADAAPPSFDEEPWLGTFDGPVVQHRRACDGTQTEETASLTVIIERVDGQLSITNSVCPVPLILTSDVTAELSPATCGDIHYRAGSFELDGDSLTITGLTVERACWTVVTSYTGSRR